MKFSIPKTKPNTLIFFVRRHFIRSRGSKSDKFKKLLRSCQGSDPNFLKKFQPQNLALRILRLIFCGIHKDSNHFCKQKHIFKSKNVYNTCQWHTPPHPQTVTYWHLQQTIFYLAQNTKPNVTDWQNDWKTHLLTVYDTE